jgi:protein phosphatase
MFDSVGLSDLGLRRHNNEDRLLVREDLALYVVADGMGGHAAGEVAAELATDEMARVIETTGALDGGTRPAEWDPHRSVNANRLVTAILCAHRRVTRASEADAGLRGMGATITAALLDGARGQLAIAHVGDSRAYLLHENSLRLMTRDHSWVGEQVAAGILSEEAARNHPLKNVVTRALGGAHEPVADADDHVLATGDLLLLCSDGLNTMVPDGDISAILRRGRGLKELAHELVAEANRRGGVDNITVILVRAMA